MIIQGHEVTDWNRDYLIKRATKRLAEVQSELERIRTEHHHDISFAGIVSELMTEERTLKGDLMEIPF